MKSHMPPRNGEVFILHEDDIPWSESSRGEKFAWKRKQLGAAAGGKKLGCSLMELPPGKRSWPLHYHHANEEAIFVLKGQGTLRLGDEQVEVSQGDYIALLTGEGHAHQMINTSTETLRYLCMSTMIEPDITVFPESKKIGVFAGAAPGGPKERREIQAYLPVDTACDYWNGED